mgnify:CR=1 FL=1
MATIKQRKTTNKFEILDANGYLWIWNKKQGRVYLDEAEKEFIRDGINVIENGYHASNLEDAVKIVGEE